MITVPFQEFWLQIEYLEIAMHIGGTWWFPLLHSLHVLSVCLMFGMLFMVDLRLMGLAATSHTAACLSRELLPWTVAAFLVASGTGVALFITRAASHVQNIAFQWKMLLLLLAGMNMLIFHRRIVQQLKQLDVATGMPISARLAGAISLLCWAGVILAGRWIGHIFG